MFLYRISVLFYSYFLYLLHLPRLVEHNCLRYVTGIIKCITVYYIFQSLKGLQLGNDCNVSIF